MQQDDDWATPAKVFRTPLPVSVSPSVSSTPQSLKKTPQSTLKKTPSSDALSRTPSHTPSQTPSCTPSSQTPKQQQRYPWLETPKDAEKRLPDHPDHDPRTLCIIATKLTLDIPPAAYSKFTDFERQFWDIKSKHWYISLLMHIGTLLYFSKRV